MSSERPIGVASCRPRTRPPGLRSLLRKAGALLFQKSTVVRGSPGHRLLGDSGQESEDTMPAILSVEGRPFD
jgi:hypothetical protein